LIDDVAIYDGVLSEGDLDNIIANGVPEPGSLALLAAGGLCVLRRRRG